MILTLINYTTGLPTLQTVTLYGIQSNPTTVTANNVAVSFVYVAATKVFFLIVVF